MSELETQKEQNKELTFEEICPEWSRRIANYDNLTDQQKIDISSDLLSTNRCFLGEANGFNGEWHKDCPDCYSFGGYIGPNALCRQFGLHPMKLDWDKFNKAKDAFVKHWNEKHG